MGAMNRKKHEEAHWAPRIVEMLAQAPRAREALAARKATKKTPQNATGLLFCLLDTTNVSSLSKEHRRRRRRGRRRQWHRHGYRRCHRRWHRRWHPQGHRRRQRQLVSQKLTRRLPSA